MCYTGISMTHSLIFPFLVLTVANLLFYASFYWKWPASCHVFVKWPAGQKQLDHAVLSSHIESKIWQTVLAACSNVASCSALMGECKEKLHERCCHWLATSAACGVRRKFSWGRFHSVAYGDYLYLVWAVCDVTIWRHNHVSKPTFWRSLLT